MTTNGSTPPCFSVRRHPIVGRWACADRDIAPLEVVLAESPSVVTPQAKHGPVCLVCLKKAEWEDCDKCGLPVCKGDEGEECRSQHPSMPECAIFSSTPSLRERVKRARALEADLRAKQEQMKQNGQQEDDSSTAQFSWHSLPFAAVGAIRYLAVIRRLKQERREDYEPIDETSGHWNQLDELEKLMDHSSDLDSDPEVGPHLDRLCDFLSEAGICAADARRAAGVIRTNAFGFSTAKGGEGAGLFARISLMSHSCQPNLQHVQDPKTGVMSLVAQRKIRKGEELAVTYINHFQGPTDRRRTLKEQWYFDCLCPRCEDPTECGTFADAVKCPKCIVNSGSTSEIPMMRPREAKDVESEWTCEKGCCCSATEINALEKDALSGWLEVDQTDPAAVETFLSDVCFVRLGEGNHFTLKIKSHLVILLGLREKKDNAQRDRKVLNRRLRLCQDVVNYLWKLDPEQTRKLGVFLLELNRPSMLLSKLDFDEGVIDRGEYLKRLVEMTKMEKRAKHILGYYNDNFGSDAAHLLSNLSYPGDNLKFVEQKD